MVSCTIGADEISGGKARFTVRSFCLGDSSLFKDSSIYGGVDSIKNWQWDFGDGAHSSLQNPNHLYLVGGAYDVWLKITTKTGNMDSTSHSTFIDSTCKNLLKGIVTISTGAALKNTKIYLCSYSISDTMVHQVDSAITDTIGFYSFKTTKDSIYLFAFPTLTSYPHEQPTWADTGLYFFHSNRIVLHLGTNIKNFNTIYGSNPGGSGVIGGKVNYCNICKTYGSGLPATDIRVLLADSNGKVQEYAYANSKGYFSFSNLAPSKYMIFVDQPLVKNNGAPLVTLDANNPFATNLIFTLYPTYLSLVNVTGVETKKENNYLTFYPNPTNYRLHLLLNEVFTSTNITFNGKRGYVKITDLSGKIILAQEIGSQDSMVDVSALSSGLYLIYYQNNENVWNGKFVKE